MAEHRNSWRLFIQWHLIFMSEEQQDARQTMPMCFSSPLFHFIVFKIPSHYKASRNAKGCDDEYWPKHAEPNSSFFSFFTMDSFFIISVLPSTRMNNTAWKYKPSFKAVQMETAFGNLSCTEHTAFFRTFWHWMLQLLPCLPKEVLKRMKKDPWRIHFLFLLYYKHVLTVGLICTQHMVHKI